MRAHLSDGTDERYGTVQLAFRDHAIVRKSDVFIEIPLASVVGSS